jgi:hypothetical protein
MPEPPTATVQAGDHEQGVAGKQEADEQAGLGENDEAHAEEGERAEPLDEVGRVEERY